VVLLLVPTGAADGGPYLSLTVLPRPQTREVDVCIGTGRPAKLTSGKRSRPANLPRILLNGLLGGYGKAQALGVVNGEWYDPDRFPSEALKIRLSPDGGVHLTAGANVQVSFGQITALPSGAQECLSVQRRGVPEQWPGLSLVDGQRRDGSTFACPEGTRAEHYPRLGALPQVRWDALQRVLDLVETSERPLPTTTRTPRDEALDLQTEPVAARPVKDGEKRTPKQQADFEREFVRQLNAVTGGVADQISPLAKAQALEALEIRSQLRAIPSTDATYTYPEPLRIPYTPQESVQLFMVVLRADCPGEDGEVAVSVPVFLVVDDIMDVSRLSSNTVTTWKPLQRDEHGRLDLMRHVKANLTLAERYRDGWSTIQGLDPKLKRQELAGLNKELASLARSRKKLADRLYTDGLRDGSVKQIALRQQVADLDAELGALTAERDRVEAALEDLSCTDPEPGRESESYRARREAQRLCDFAVLAAFAAPSLLPGNTLQHLSTILPDPIDPAAMRASDPAALESAQWQTIWETVLHSTVAGLPVARSVDLLLAPDADVSVLVAGAIRRLAPGLVDDELKPTQVAYKVSGSSHHASKTGGAGASATGDALRLMVERQLLREKDLLEYLPASFFSDRVLECRRALLAAAEQAAKASGKPAPSVTDVAQKLNDFKDREDGFDL